MRDLRRPKPPSLKAQALQAAQRKLYDKTTGHEAFLLTASSPINLSSMTQLDHSLEIFFRNLLR
jgi:hypothetical protein